MKILKIDHIGIAVDNLERVGETFAQLFQLTQSFTEVVADQKVNTLGFDLNGTNIEFLSALSPDSPISSFIEKRKNAVHHIALQVDNLDEWLKHLQESGVNLIDKTARIGAEHKRIAFIHPKATGGILIELTEKKHND